MHNAFTYYFRKLSHFCGHPLLLPPKLGGRLRNRPQVQRPLPRPNPKKKPSRPTSLFLLCFVFFFASVHKSILAHSTLRKILSVCWQFENRKRRHATISPSLPQDIQSTQREQKSHPNLSSWKPLVIKGTGKTGRTSTAPVKRMHQALQLRVKNSTTNQIGL